MFSIINSEIAASYKYLALADQLFHLLYCRFVISIEIVGPTLSGQTEWQSWFGVFWPLQFTLFAVPDAATLLQVDHFLWSVVPLLGVVLQASIAKYEVTLLPVSVRSTCTQWSMNWSGKISQWMKFNVVYSNLKEGLENYGWLIMMVSGVMVFNIGIHAMVVVMHKQLLEVITIHAYSMYSVTCGDKVFDLLISGYSVL